jgi:hypothetical protein
MQIGMVAVAPFDDDDEVGGVAAILRHTPGSDGGSLILSKKKNDTRTKTILVVNALARMKIFSQEQCATV